MENISDVYNKLKKICDVCWAGDEHDSIYIYSCDQKYRLFVSSDILYVEKKYRIFKWEYWDSFTHIHTEFYKSDAQFFINLTQNDTVSVQNAVVQAQNMINSGADVSDVQQNVKISQALLDAINNAKETNQPLRIDFDQNVSVVLRIGKDGAIAANFIPGDKAVEQYLRNNIESLKATFNENDLPYTDLSYSNSSKQQNERRRNKQQQGEQ